MVHHLTPHVPYVVGTNLRGINLKELVRGRWKVVESINDYLNKFRILKAKCFTQVPEHELVELTAGGLDYSTRNKFDTLYLRDMAQLADRVWQVKHLKAEKSRSSKYYKKEKVTYIKIDKIYQIYDTDCVEEGEVNLNELKLRSPYICKLLKPSNAKNPFKPSKNEKFVTKTYTFNVAKCDEIFDLLVYDGQIIVPRGLKTPSLK